MGEVERKRRGRLAGISGGVWEEAAAGGGGGKGGLYIAGITVRFINVLRSYGLCSFPWSVGSVKGESLKGYLYGRPAYVTAFLFYTVLLY